MVRVDLYDNCPSATSLRETSREILWRIVSRIECLHNPMLQEEPASDNDDTDLIDLVPTRFVSSKRPASRKKRRQLTHFSSYRLEHNLFLALNKGDRLWYPAQIVGVGPSLPSLHFSTVMFLGYNTTAEVHRATELMEIPVDMKADVIELALRHYSHDSHHTLSKYWDQRYRLFTRYDYGVQLDDESWFSVTPEAIAIDVAMKCRALLNCLSASHGVVLDCFCGVGGNAIALARQEMFVIAVDIDYTKLSMLRHNSAIYNVEENIEPVCCDAYHLLRNWNHSGIDIIMLAPPWGGVDYTSSKFDLHTMIGGGDGIELVEIAASICRNIVYIIPRNTPGTQLSEIAKRTGLHYRVERIYLHDKHKMNVVYFGDFV